MIWCVEDDASIRDIEVYTLTSTGFEARGFDDGVSFWSALQTEKPDLVVLDVMLPDIDGLTVCRNLRNTPALAETPIIMLTAKGEEDDVVLGLEMGADDYITKPFEAKEVLARIKAVLRRTSNASAPEAENNIKQVSYDNLSINLTNYELRVKGEKVDAPPKELELLYHLASNPNRVFTRDQLLDEVWGFDYYGDSRTVDVHVKRIREKLEGVSDKWEIKTVWSVGYKFETKD